MLFTVSDKKLKKMKLKMMKKKKKMMKFKLQNADKGQLAFTTLGANSADNKLIFFLFFPENRSCLNLHEYQN